MKTTAPIERLDPLNDFLFLKVMGEKGDEFQLQSLLNAILRHTHTINSVEIIENKSLSADFIGQKSSILDVRARLDSGSKVNLEVQLRNQLSFDRRTLFYWSKLFSENLKAGNKYPILPSVIAINIVHFDFPTFGGYHTRFRLWEDFTFSGMLSNALEIHFINMIKWKRLETKDLNNSLHRWLTWLDKNSPPELIAEAMRMDEGIKAANERQAQVTLEEEAQELYWKRQIALMDQLDYDHGLDKARQEGLEEGWQEGLEEGLEKGRQEKLAIGRNLKAAGVSLDIISQSTGLTIEEILKL